VDNHRVELRSQPGSVDMSFLLVTNAACTWREWGELFANRRECREADKRSGVGPYETRPDAGPELEAMRAGIGAALRTLHSDVLREQVPESIAELLRRLDQQEADTA
jgi:hypothetical protein